MRQLPATGYSGTTGTTENSRSRFHSLNDVAGVSILSNGSVKEPIVTRSKSRLGKGRRLSERSPKMQQSPGKSVVSELSRKLDKRVRVNSNSNHSVSRCSSSSPNYAAEEKLYARHYKSYRGLNGVKSRRAEKSKSEGSHSSRVVKTPPDSSQTSKDRHPSNNSINQKRNGSLQTNMHQNGISRRSQSTPKSTRTPSSRIRQLVLKRKKQLSNRLLRGNVSPPRSPNIDSKTKATCILDSTSPGKDKAGKRRSALWVLNCEAESFLFGETAAEKHEVELPPLGPPSPPQKKRRWRATELGHLLEKSPILQSKLRKSTSSDSGSDTQREPSPPRRRVKGDNRKAVGGANSSKSREKTPEMCSNLNKSFDEDLQQEVLSPNPELLSPIPFLYSPDSVDFETRSIQFRQMLSNLNYGYSFETVPDHEPWYGAYTRTESSILPFSYFSSSLHKPLLLPYEMDRPIRRSRSKLVKNSRKSPRCHASTLAILSSERPTRSTRSSVVLDTSPSPSINNSPAESELQTLLLSPSVRNATVVATPPPPPPTVTIPTPSASTSSVPKIVPSTTFRRNPSTTSPKPTHRNETEKELGAAQYLWDSIQFLSDPYVVTLLAGDEPTTASELRPRQPVQHSNHINKESSPKNQRCSNTNYVNCPVKIFSKLSESSARKASLRSGDGAISNAAATNVINCSRLVPTPKSSPRNQSKYGTNNHYNCHTPVTSQPTSPTVVRNRGAPMNGYGKKFTSRSPPLLPSKRSAEKYIVGTLPDSKTSGKGSPKNTTNNGRQFSMRRKEPESVADNMLISNGKKNAIVLVKDLFKPKVKFQNSWEEETLFAGDGLPAPPHWPV